MFHDRNYQKIIGISYLLYLIHVVVATDFAHDASFSLTLFTLRECVDKLQLLKTPEERQRRISEVPVIHADPKMDPNYESEEDSRIGDNINEGTSIMGLCGLELKISSFRYFFCYCFISLQYGCT